MSPPARSRVAARAAPAVAMLVAIVPMTACGDDDTPSSAADATTASTTTVPDADDSEHQPDESMSGHSHSSIDVDDWAAIPTVALHVEPDALSGFNIWVDTTNFTFAPEHASGDPVDGEGHAHLYVDGEKVARLYSSWYHLEPLDPGDHEITVELNGNDHATLLLAGDPISATETVSVPADASDGAHPGAVIAVTVVDGAVEGGGRQKVSLGDELTVRVTSDVDDEVHLHGYDLTVDVAAGETVDLTFVADIPGVFEVELEQAHIRLLELEVS